jgi:hypothetical protein
MDWGQFAIMFVTFVALFFWNRTENRADIRHMDGKLESNRNLSVQIHKENQDLINAIRQDIKDFHGRLCAIEERNKGMS